MPGSAVDVGFGVAISDDGGGTAFGQVLDVSGPTMSREAVETTHSGTSPGVKTWMPSDLTDGGEVVVETHQNTLGTEPHMIDKAAANYTITLPLTTGDMGAATWVFSGFVIGHDTAFPLEDTIKSTITIKVAGDVTFNVAT